MKFTKYHALGNDYLVLDPRSLPKIGRRDVALFNSLQVPRLVGDRPRKLDRRDAGGAPPKDQDPPLVLRAELIRTICDRHYGIGSDGLLFGPLPSAKASFSLKIYNLDGSEAEKSGNGLRIFCRYLWDGKLVNDKAFSVETKGGVVQAQILCNGKIVRIEMGTVSFRSEDIPIAGQPREVLREQIRVDDRTFQFSAATIGNPHCVILLDDISPELAKQYGPLLEVHPTFPNRTNVQFVKVLDRKNIRIEIWERGAGYTLASGSSSCASAATAFKLGLCDADITVHMPGGRIEVSLDDSFRVVMTGPVTRVAEGHLSGEIFDGGKVSLI